MKKFVDLTKPILKIISCDNEVSIEEGPEGRYDLREWVSALQEIHKWAEISRARRVALAAKNAEEGSLLSAPESSGNPELSPRKVIRQRVKRID